jgi:hypothetical protein
MCSGYQALKSESFLVRKHTFSVEMLDYVFIEKKVFLLIFQIHK